MGSKGGKGGGVNLPTPPKATMRGELPTMGETGAAPTLGLSPEELIRLQASSSTTGTAGPFGTTGFEGSPEAGYTRTSTIDPRFAQLLQAGTQGVDYGAAIDPYTTGQQQTIASMLTGGAGEALPGGGQQIMGDQLSQLLQPTAYDPTQRDYGDYAKSTFEQAASLLRPEQERARSAAEVGFSERGLPTGSEIRSERESSMARSQNEAMNRLALQSVAQGEQARIQDLTSQAQQFQVGQGARGQDIASILQAEQSRRGQVGLEAGLAGQEQGMRQGDINQLMQDIAQRQGMRLGEAGARQTGQSQSLADILNITQAQGAGATGPQANVLDPYRMQYGAEMAPYQQDVQQTTNEWLQEILRQRENIGSQNQMALAPYQAQVQSAMQQYGADQSAKSGLLGGLTTLGAGYMMGPMGAAAAGATT